MKPSVIESASAAILSLDATELEELVQHSLTSMTPLQVAEQIISPALERIGVLWEEGNANLAQIFLGSKLCEDVLLRILPQEAHWRKDSPVIGITNFDDHHSLGKKIVHMTLRSSGHNIIDLGWTDADSIAPKVREHKVQVLMVSTLMLRSALRTKAIPRLLKEANSSAVMVVGGAPFLFDPELAREVGAEALGSSGADAAGIVQALLEAMR